MKTKLFNKNAAIIILSICLLVALISPATAQKKLENSPGGYHGELDFPISWKRYYAYSEWTKIMHDMQKKYPHLADIESIGKSRMGRDMYLLTITGKSAGDHTTKPAMWVDGAIHGNEVNGISCSLYIAWYLLTRYDYDKYIHDIVDNSTFYILPGMNVDANESYVEFPNTANNPREPYRPEDNDGDGLYDEDRTEDVDGDGELSQMYIVDPSGDYKLSSDKRRFIRVVDKEDKVMRFRMIGSEGFDNDGDGRINEDDIGGPDGNRNFPAGWNLQAGNPYPLSEFCTRNAYEFMLDHPNIFAGFCYHNIGRLIMFVNPPRAKTTPGQAQGQAQGSPFGRRGPQLTFEQRLAEMRKTNKYAQAFDFQVEKGYEGDMKAQIDIVTVGARIMKNYRPTPSSGNGMTPASLYDMFGAYSYLIELWGSPTEWADENNDGRVSEEERMNWIDTDLNNEGWVEPHKYTHPDIGEVWIGGTQKKHMSRTPPGRYIEQEAERNALFVIYCASQFPKVEIDEVNITPATQNLYWVDISVKNDKIYPTSSDRSVKLKKAVEDKLSFSSSNNITLLEVPEGSTIIDPLNRQTSCKTISKKETEFRLKGKETLKFRYLVEMKGDKGWINFDLISKNGGKDNKKVDINIGN
ncbi:M14 family metallopeptidase [Bacteroidota bacterium]